MHYNLKEFLKSRNMYDDSYNGNKSYLNHMVNVDLYLMDKFEEKMSRDKKFHKYVMNRIEIETNIRILKKLDDEQDKYDAIVKFMYKYLDIKKK